MGIDLLTLAKVTITNPNDDWGLVGSTVATGLLVVFMILVVLIFVFWAMGKVMTAITNRGQKKAEAAKPVEVAVEAPMQAEVVEEAYDNDDEIIAVISAAVAAYSEADGKQYRIASISKKNEKNVRSNWSASGIAENTRPF